MKGNKAYIIYILVLGALLAFVVLSQQKSYDWEVTLSPEDKNPYGAYALNELLPSFFIDKKISHSFKTFYEIKDSMKTDKNYFVLCSSFHPDKEDTRALLKFLQDGGNVLVSANYLYGDLADTLGIETRDYLFGGENNISRSDTTLLHIANPHLDTLQTFSYRRENAHNYFYRADTAEQHKKFLAVPITVVAKNDLDQPVMIKVDYGKGHLILNCTPMIFTNIYLLSKENHALISSTLSYLPQRDVLWSEYYQVGRMEASTPLRFILLNEPLSWAYYIVIFSLLLFIIFEAKRRQRIIPIVKPLSNTTLEFVSTIGNLYYQTGDHKNIAEKKIAYLFDKVRQQYFITLSTNDAEFVKTLSRKAGKEEKEVNELMNYIHLINEKKQISKDELIYLNQLIEKFWS